MRWRDDLVHYLPPPLSRPPLAPDMPEEAVLGGLGVPPQGEIITLVSVQFSSVQFSCPSLTHSNVKGNSTPEVPHVVPPLVACGAL